MDSVENDRDPARELTMLRRTVVALGLVFAVIVTFVGGTRAWSLAADSHKRANESEARQSTLYRQLADRDAILESQRRMYMDRLRRLEAQVRERELNVVVGCNSRVSR